MSIDDLRKRIDDLDARLVRLLNERTQVAMDIGKLKRKSGEEFYTPHREEAVLKRVLTHNDGPLTEQALRAIWREVMSAALAIEKELVIAFVGTEGSPAHEAARLKFGGSLHYKGKPTIADVAAEVTKLHADYGIVPVEQLKDGVRTHVSDVLRECELQVCAEIIQPSRHLVIGRQAAARTGRDKTVVLFSLPDRVGALEESLAVFRRNGVNLVNIESRPVLAEKPRSLFFVELHGHASDRAMRQALDELCGLGDLVRVLGTYAAQD